MVHVELSRRTRELPLGTAKSIVFSVSLKGRFDSTLLKSRFVHRLPGKGLGGSKLHLDDVVVLAPVAGTKLETRSDRKTVSADCLQSVSCIAAR